jgi:predicted nucleic acid-binding protein
MLDYLVPVFVTPRAEERAREVQLELIRRGRHRAVGIPDLLVAAVAEIERLTVLRYDADFELVASITGQPVGWLLPRGTIE